MQVVYNFLKNLSWFTDNILGINVALFIFLFFIMIIDYITGLSAAIKEEKDSAKKEGRKMKTKSEVFESKKGLGWVFKIGFYFFNHLGNKLFYRKFKQ